MYQRIYEMTNRIPRGRVSTYGAIAQMVGGCTPRMVGYALSAADSDLVVWHRVINAKGEVSPRSDPAGESVQRQLLEQEGVLFNDRGKVDLKVFGWDWDGISPDDWS